MFSTTLTTLDASPRALVKTGELLGWKPVFKKYSFWLIILILGTSAILFFFISEMGLLVKIATILSFLTAPFYAIFNFRAFKKLKAEGEARLTRRMELLCYLGIAFLIGFSIWYLITLF